MTFFTPDEVKSADNRHHNISKKISFRFKKFDKSSIHLKFLEIFKLQGLEISRN